MYYLPSAVKDLRGEAKINAEYQKKLTNNRTTQLQELKKKYKRSIIKTLFYCSMVIVLCLSVICLLLNNN